MVKALKEVKGRKVQAVWSNEEPKYNSLYSAKTNKGRPIFFWKADAISSEVQKKQLKRGLDSSYACHGFTIGSHQYQGGPFTPHGSAIDRILKDEFKRVKISCLQVNDVVAWQDEEGFISHTARITELKLDGPNKLRDDTRLATKNGIYLYRERARLATLKQIYGHDISFFREKKVGLTTSLPRTPAPN